MMFFAAFVVAAVHRAVFAPSSAFAPALHGCRHGWRSPSILSFANHENECSPVSPPELLRFHLSPSAEERATRRVPRRALPHVKNASRAEAATRAGYIVQEPRVDNPTTNNVEREEFTGESSPRPSLGPGGGERNGARRVTFKATRESARDIASNPIATLTEYMSQPVSQYSLLSFHDGEGSSLTDSGRNQNGTQSKSRRWLVRRLTTREARCYINDGIDESNLFQLTVPLLPLIGWDLTPVIDLEVTSPQGNRKRLLEDVTENPYIEGANHFQGDGVQPEGSTSTHKWAPLRGIRKHIRQGENANNIDALERPPAVQIRSLRVSLLSTHDKANELVTRDKRRRLNKRRGSAMQQEAIEMAGKVEEWLKPHILFRAEISWQDACLSHGDGIAASPGPSQKVASRSTVTATATAVTSLTIPRIPASLLGPAVPSAFLAKRLGATLTSRALAVCLPRFLRQLEKDYVRWSGPE